MRFNILYGKYDYVVLQEHAHPFGPEEDFLNASMTLNDMIREAGSTPVIYECWAKKDEPEVQNHMADSLMNEISQFLEDNCEAEILEEQREIR